MPATPTPVVPWRSFGYTMSELSIRHYLLRHSSIEGEVKRGKWVCAAHQPLCRSTNVLYWWGFRRRFERTRLTGYETPLFTHSSPNLWSRGKWNEWIPVCLKRWGSWRLIDWVFSGSWTSRRFVREKGNRGWGLDVTAIASDCWFKGRSIEWWGNERMGTWGLEGIGVFEALLIPVDSIRCKLRDIYIN